MKLTFLLTALLLLSSCGSYINSMYREFDRADQKGRPVKQRDSFSQYRYPEKFKTPSRLTTTTSSKNLSRIDPSTKRLYKSGAKKRFSADDLNDNSSTGSLWSGEGRDASLYSVDQNKRNGDIILINVMAQLKNEITMELKRQAPPPKKKKTAAGEKPKEGAPAEAAAAAKPEVKEEEATDVEKVYDKISSVIIEEVQKEHILLRGLKNVLFNNQKHLVEVQALVSRRDVGTDDAVSSDKIVEYSIQVVR